MANTFVIACPECAKQVKVGEEHIGKKVRCKSCGEVFPIQAPGGAAKPKAAAAKAKAPPAPAKAKAPPPPEPEPANAPIPFKDEPEEEENSNPYGLTQTNDTLPRCPFCAKEMPSEEALICLHCGYNTRTRSRHQTKAVYEPTSGEIFLWLLPGILCIVAILALIVEYIFFYINIEFWMADGWFEDEKGPPVVWLAGFSPGLFRLYHFLALAGISYLLGKKAYKRLIKEYRPPEKKIKEED
jgi:predicted Zn finger-like uncharacterized protein